MNPNEPSRTALMIARQRAAHQVLDHGAILNDPFAMKILREDEKEVLPFAGNMGQTGRFRIILPESVAELEQRSSDVRKRSCPLRSFLSVKDLFCC
jgi:O-methyltransferase involved in polyketide biosynthesis